MNSIHVPVGSDSAPMSGSALLSEAVGKLMSLCTRCGALTACHVTKLTKTPLSGDEAENAVPPQSHAEIDQNVARRCDGESSL